MRLLYCAALALVASCERHCPEILCVPVISVSYSTPIAGNYTVELSVLDSTPSVTECPKAHASVAASEVACSAAGLTIQGSELFLGPNPPAAVGVAVSRLTVSARDIVSNAIVNARVNGSANGDGCRMNCYRASGELTLPAP
jgi:hypothetical protein